MATDQVIQEILDRLGKLEQEVLLLRKQASAYDWEAKIIEQINKGDMLSAMQIYQNFNHHASISEATRHIMEIKQRMKR